MLIQGLLVGAIGGIFAYTCKIVYEANKSDDELTIHLLHNFDGVKYIVKVEKYTNAGCK